MREKQRQALTKRGDIAETKLHLDLAKKGTCTLRKCYYFHAKQSTHNQVNLM